MATCEISSDPSAGLFVEAVDSKQKTRSKNQGINLLIHIDPGTILDLHAEDLYIQQTGAPGSLYLYNDELPVELMAVSMHSVHLSRTSNAGGITLPAGSQSPSTQKRPFRPRPPNMQMPPPPTHQSTLSPAQRRQMRPPLSNSPPPPL